MRGGNVVGDVHIGIGAQFQLALRLQRMVGLRGIAVHKPSSAHPLAYPLLASAYDLYGLMGRRDCRRRRRGEAIDAAQPSPIAL